MLLRKLLAGLGLGALAAVIVLGLAASTDLLDRLELTTYDWRMRLAADPDSVNKDIVLVEINDSSIREMSPLFGHWPWPRLAISFVVDYLHRAPAKVVAIDVGFAEPDKARNTTSTGEGRLERKPERSRAGRLGEEGRERDPARRRRL